MPRGHFNHRLDLECRAVARLRTLYILALLGAVSCIVLLPLSLSVLCVLIAVTAGMAVHCWRQRCELGGKVVALLWDREGRWWWKQAGEETELLLSPDSYLSPGMVILNFTHPETGHRRSLVLLPVSVGPERYRRLCVQLMLERRHLRSGPENSAG